MAKGTFKRRNSEMKIPVFVSRPNELTPDQDAVMDEFFALLDGFALEPRTLQKQTGPEAFLLDEIRTMISQCAGGLIIGFVQEAATNIDRYNRDPLPHKSYPTPWNHIEAGLLFASHVPLLVWREPSITGGVFDNGVTGEDVHIIGKDFSRHDETTRSIFSNWQAEIRRTCVRA